MSEVRLQLMKVLVVENTHNHVGMCPGDAWCHTPHLFGSALMTGAFNHFIELHLPFYTNNVSIEIHKKIDLSFV